MACGATTRASFGTANLKLERFSTVFAVNRLISTLRFAFFFSSRRRHTILQGDWSSDVCSSDLHRGDLMTRRVARLTWTVLPILAILPPLAGPRPFAQEPPPAPPPAAPGSAAQSEIGRASCRERV